MERVIIDTDPGIDDAMAIFLTASVPEKSCYIHSVSDYDNCVFIPDFLLSVSVSEDTGRFIPEYVSIYYKVSDPH